MSFLYHPQRRKPTKQARIIAAIAAAAAAMGGVVSNLFGTRKPGTHAGTATTNAVIVVTAVIVVIVALLITGKSITAGAADDAVDDGARDDATGSDHDIHDEEGRRPFVLLATAIVLVAAIVIALFATARAAPAQAPADRGALYIRHGTDTVVTDRFEWVGDTLRGRAQLKGQGAVEYFALLGPGYELRKITYDLYAPVAKDGDAPAAHIVFTMSGDTAIAEVPSGVQRVPTKHGSIPMMNNLLALTELSVRRAKATGVPEVPWLAVAGGATNVVVIKPVGADSVVMTIGVQEQRFRVDAVGRILGGTIPGRGLDYIRGGPAAAGALRAVSAGARSAPPDYSAPPGAPYTAEEVKIAAIGGFTLGGTLTKPKNISGRLPAVVTITGSGQQDRDEYSPSVGGVRLYRQLADTLSRRGIVVLRMDDRGLGASGGDPTLATSADFANDIRSAVRYLRSRPDIDPDRIALVGHSEGGMIAPMIAATDPRIHAIVSFAGPAVRGYDILLAQNKYAIDHTPSLSQSTRDSLMHVARTMLAPGRQTVPWLKFFIGYDPVPALRQVKVPALVVQGATDSQIPVAQADLYAKAIRAGGNRDVTVRIFPATDHLFLEDSTGDPTGYSKLKSNRVKPEILGIVADWLVQKLGALPVVK
ncbi:MAG: alpha/beta hydrolase family protein [Gemmatimonadales bacterium]